MGSAGAMPASSLVSLFVLIKAPPALPPSAGRHGDQSLALPSWRERLGRHSLQRDSPPPRGLRSSRRWALSSQPRDLLTDC